MRTVLRISLVAICLSGPLYAGHAMALARGLRSPPMLPTSASSPVAEPDLFGGRLGQSDLFDGRLAQANDEKKKLVVLPMLRTAGVPLRTWQTVADAVAAESAYAGKKRGYRIIPLRKVASAERLAKSCRDAKCRAEIIQRLGADVALVGAVHKAKRGYRVELWLEGADGQVISLQKAEGRMFTLTAKVPDLTASVLEAGSSKESVTRRRLVTTAVSYERAGRPKDAARTYARAIAVNPFHADAARLSIKVMQVWERAEDLAKSDAALDELIETYGPTSPWGQAGLGGPDVQAEVGRAVSAYLVRAGTRHHERALALDGDKAQAKQRHEHVEQAFVAYRRAVDLYPSGTVDDGIVGFHLAEVAYELEEFAFAVQGYAAAKAVGTQKQQALATEGLCFALEGELRKLRLFDGGKSHKVSPRQKKLPAQVAAYVAAAEDLWTRFPDGENSAVFMFRAAQAELVYGHRAPAKARLQKVVAAGRDPETLNRARRLLGKI